MDQEIDWKADKSILNGKVWSQDCVNVEQCDQTAYMQQQSPVDPDNWFTVKDGSSTTGCTPVTYAWVNVDCKKSEEVYVYRTLGIYVIFYDDGTNNTYDEPGNTLSLGYSC